MAGEVDAIHFQFEDLVRRRQILKTPLEQMPHYLPIVEWEKSKAILADGVEDERTWDLLGDLYYSVMSMRAYLGRSQPGHAIDEQRLQKLNECVRDSDELKTLLQAERGRAVRPEHDARL